MNTFLNRRRFLQFGTVALGGLGLSSLLQAAPNQARRARANACILLYMDGGPSHLDLWDMKPTAPLKIRGPFQPIATSVPGILGTVHDPFHVEVTPDARVVPPAFNYRDKVSC